MSVLAGRDLTVELRSLNGKRQLEELAAPARDTKRQVVIAIEVAAGENLKEKQVNGRLARVRGGIRSLRGRQSETRSSSDAPASPTARKGESPKQVKGEKSAADENGAQELSGTKQSGVYEGPDCSFALLLAPRVLLVCIPILNSPCACCLAFSNSKS